MVSANAPTPPPDASAAASGEDASKKVRKPYTITKSRESWTEQEHDKFLEALQLFDRDWKKIEAFVGSKTVIQIRSHAQKYFLKVQKNGTSEHVPPPRPKRKAAHPYPQKASKNEPGYALKTDSSSMLRNAGMNAAVSSWTHNSIPPVVASSMVKDLGAGTMGPNNFCSSSTEGPPRAWQPGETNDQINQVPSLRLMPDFAQVYNFLGSVFDPSTSGHLQKLKEMNPIDVETALLLMRNLSINLTSSDFEDQGLRNCPWFLVLSVQLAVTCAEWLGYLGSYQKMFVKSSCFSKFLKLYEILRKLLSSYSSASDGLELGSSRSSLLADRPLSAALCEWCFEVSSPKISARPRNGGFWWSTDEGACTVVFLASFQLKVQPCTVVGFHKVISVYSLMCIYLCPEARIFPPPIPWSSRCANFASVKA